MSRVTRCPTCSWVHAKGEAHRCDDCGQAIAGEPADQWDGPDGHVLRCATCVAKVEAGRAPG